MIVYAFEEACGCSAPLPPNKRLTQTRASARFARVRAAEPHGVSQTEKS